MVVQKRLRVRSLKPRLHDAVFCDIRFSRDWKTLSLVMAITLAACAPQDKSIEAACTELVLDYAYHRDRLDAEQIGELFTEDATMSLLGDVFDGRTAIMQRTLDGKSGPVTRHLMSTIRIFPESADSATGVSYVTIYLAPRRGSTNPLAVEGFAGIGEYHDEFARTPSGWKIASREFRPTFVYEDQQ